LKRDLIFGKLMVKFLNQKMDGYEKEHQWGRVQVSPDKKESNCEDKFHFVADG